MLYFVRPGEFYLDFGPIQMTLQAFKDNLPLDKEIKSAAGYACQLLQELSPCLRLAKIPAALVKQTNGIPGILKNMIAAAGRCHDPLLTPMAAVAGAVADTVADYLVRNGATKAIVNNGGDIAIRIIDDSTVRVGIKSTIDAPSHDFVLELNSSSGIGGIATSGLGGRGFTKGIASAAVCLAADCSTADACATVVANSTFHPHPGIKQVAADTLDPATDIRGQLVTLFVNDLDQDTYQKALHKGMDRADRFLNQKLLIGTVLFTGGCMAVKPVELKNKIRPAGKSNSNFGGGVINEQ